MRQVSTLLCIFWVSTGAIGQITQQDMEKAIGIENLEHPYLYFSESEKPAMMERIENDPESRDILIRLKAEADRLMYTPVETEAPKRNTHPRFSTDKKYTRYMQKHASAAFHLAFMYQMTGDAAYAKKSFEFAEAICALQSWTYVAHEFPIIYSRVWPKYVNDDTVVFNSDIRTVYMAHFLSAVYDWTYDVLTKRQRDRIRGALLEKVILPVRGEYEYFWDATAYASNHCMLFYSGIGAASLALLTENPELTDVTTEAYNRTLRIYSHFGVDGGWQEGAPYFAYGIANSIYFMEMLRRVTDGTYNLFQQPRLHANPATFWLYGITANFGDNALGAAGSTWVLNKLTEETDNGLAAWYREQFKGEGKTVFDILWPRSAVTPVPPTEPSKHFRSIDWVIMQSDFNNPDNVVIACKAGMNDDPHHGHLDVGQFILNWRGQAYIKDVGKAYPYDEKYFNNVRFEYPHVSSRGHNLVFVNGECQISAKYKDQPWREGIGGEVVECRLNSDREYALLDPTNAYEKVHLESWRRHIILEKPRLTVVVDEVLCDEGDEIETRFHSQCEPELREDHVVLHGDKGMMALIPVVNGDFAFRPGRHSFLALRTDAEHQWIPYFGTVLTAKEKKTVVATIIAPVKDEAGAKDLVNSIQRKIDTKGNLTLSLAYEGEALNFYFENKSDQLLLSED